MSSREILFAKKNEMFICEMSLQISNMQLQWMWDVLCQDIHYRIVFSNVSRINIRDLSYPLQLNGIEFIDNEEKGWDGDSRYLVRDWEDQSFHFYCENFEIIEG